MPTTSGSFSVSADRTKAMTCVSHLKPSANSGRIGRSIMAAGENFALAGTAFALDKAAGNASAGVGVFAIIDGEREEIDAFAGIGIGHGGGENDIVADADHGGAVGLFGNLAGFECEGFTAGEFYGNFCGFWFHDSSFLGQEGERRAMRRSQRQDERMPICSRADGREPRCNYSLIRPAARRQREQGEVPRIH